MDKDVMLKFPTMQDLFEYKATIKLSGNNATLEFDSNTIKAHLTMDEIKLAIEQFNAFKLI
jgi:hypothetical protein